MLHLQHIANDAHAPHVRLEVNGLIANNLGGNKFRRTEEHTGRRLCIQPLGESKVNDFYLMTGPSVTHDVLGLQIQMHHTLTVHVRNSFAHLTQKQNAIHLRQRKVVGHNAFEEFTTRYAISEEDVLLKE